MKTEARVKSEGKAGREDPTWNYRGGIIESLKWNKKCVPQTSLKCSLSEGRGCDPPPCPWAPSGVGWVEGASSGCLSAGSSPGSAATCVLCCQEARFLPSTLLLLPSLFPWFSRLLPARLETQASQDLRSSPWAVLAPPSSFSAGLTGCLVFIAETFLACSFLHSWWWDAQGN